MKVLNQIQGRTFAVELDDNDFNDEFMIYVSHEVCHFVGKSYMQRKEVSLEGFKGDEYKPFCSNIPVRVNLGIDVRTMIELVLPYLQKHYYLQPKHIEGGDYNYMGNYPITLIGCEMEEKINNRTYVSTKRTYKKITENYNPIGKWHVIETRHKYDCLGETEYEDEVKEFDIEQKYL